MKRFFLLGAGLALILFFIASCESSTASEERFTGEALVQVLLTDAPADYIAEAWVWISRVYLIAGDQEPEEGPPFIDLFNDPDEPLMYDLLTLRDGITADMTGEVEIPAGVYNQLRMIVADAEVTLIDGYTFRDGTTTRGLQIPSGAQTGIKVNLNGAVVAETGTLNTILVDFDVDQNFVIQGNPETPAGIQGILFTPMLRELSRTVDEG